MSHRAKKRGGGATVGRSEHPSSMATAAATLGGKRAHGTLGGQRRERGEGSSATGRNKVVIVHQDRFFFLPALRSSCLVLAHAHTAPTTAVWLWCARNRPTRPRLVPPPAPQLLYRRNGKRMLRWERQEGESGEHAGEDGEPTGGGPPVASPCPLAPGALAPSPPPAPCVVTNRRGWAHRALGGWEGRGGSRRSLGPVVATTAAVLRRVG